jgi:hypothetical protein
LDFSRKSKKCICVNTSISKILGASEEEIEAVLPNGAEVGHLSTSLNGNQVDIESFKFNWDNILYFVKSHSK